MNLLRPIILRLEEGIEQFRMDRLIEHLLAAELHQEDGQLAVDELVPVREHLQAIQGDTANAARPRLRVDEGQLNRSQMIEDVLGFLTRRTLVQPLENRVSIVARLADLA